MNLKSRFVSSGFSPVRRRSRSTSASEIGWSGGIEPYESRLLLSAHALHLAGDVSHGAAKSTTRESGGSFDGIWYIHVDRELVGNLTLVQEGNEVKSLVNDVFTDAFEGQVKENKLKLHSEVANPGSSEKTVVTWKVTLDSNIHFAGTQTQKGPGRKLILELAGDL